MSGSTTTSPYLLGPFAPIAEEAVSGELKVIGEVPRDLWGSYVRNGPNPRFAPKGRYHWFDGDGMLHAVHFENGRASYRCRYVETAAFDEEAHAEASLWTGLLESSDGNPSHAPYKDTANTDVVFHNGALVALWYISGTPYVVDTRNLETLGVARWASERTLSVSAHAKVDDTTGEMMFFTYGPQPPFMRYGVVGADGVLDNLIDIDLPGPRLPHDMAVTEHWSILMDLPLFHSPAAAEQNKWIVQYHSDMPARFGILPRRGAGTEVRWFETEPCYIYHTVNAWEEGSEVVMLACRTVDPLPQPDPADGSWAKMMANLRLRARLHEWRFDLETGQTRERALDDRDTEFPAIDAGHLGRKSRYNYNVSVAGERTLLFDGLVKYDTATGTDESWQWGDGRFGSEAAFAPRQGRYADDEDDGYLISFVHDEREQRSEAVILDARSPSKGPLARVLLPQRVPLGFHACWVPGERIPRRASR